MSVKFYNITTDETRVPHEVEAQDGYYCHSADYKELEQELIKWKQAALALGHGLSYEAELE